MTLELRQIATLCDIVSLETRQTFEQGLPNQLVEVLPRPASTAGESDDAWKPWYFARVYADDGIRFCEGMVAKEATKPFSEAVDKESFAVECFNAAKAAGVNPVELLAVADYLSGIEESRPKQSVHWPFPFSSGELGRPHYGHAGFRSEPGGSLLSV